jgi:hypothetical protein
MNMNNPSSSFIQGINNTVDANRLNPQALQQEVAQDSRKPIFQQDLVRLISAEIINKQMADTQNSVNLALNPESSTVAEQTFQTTSRNMEAQVAQRVAGVNAVKAAERNKQMNALMGPRGTGIQSLPTNLSMNRSNTASMGGIVGAAMGGHIRGYAQGGVASFDGTGDSLVDGDTPTVEEPYTVGSALGEGTDYVVELAEDNMLATIALGIAGARVKKVQRGVKSVIQMSKSVYDDALAIYKNGNYGRKQRNQRMLDRGVKTGYTAAVAATIPDVLDIPLDDGTSTTPKIDEEVVPLTGITETDEERMQKLLAAEMEGMQRAEKANAIPNAIDASTSTQQDALAKSLDTTNTGILAARALGEGQADSRKTYEDNLRNSAERGESQLNAAITGRDNLATNTERDLKTGQETYITDLENLANNARGGRREALRDLLYGLSQVGRGSNLGDGLGIAGRTMIDREQGREDKAFGIDQKIADVKRGDVTELNALKLSNNAGIQDLRTSLANMRTSNQALLASTNAQTAQLAQTNLKSITALTQIAADSSLKSAGIEYKGLIAKLEAASRDATLAIQGRANEIQAEGQTSKNLIAIIEGLNTTIQNISLVSPQGRKDPRLPGYITETNEYLAQLKTILSGESSPELAEPEPPI